MNSWRPIQSSPSASTSLAHPGQNRPGCARLYIYAPTYVTGLLTVCQLVIGVENGALVILRNTGVDASGGAGVEGSVQRPSIRLYLEWRRLTVLHAGDPTQLPTERASSARSAGENPPVAIANNIGVISTCVRTYAARSGQNV